MPEIRPGNPAVLRSHRAADPLRWTPRHLGDEIRERHERAVQAAEAEGKTLDEPPPRENERVRCRCGRSAPAFAMVDVRGLHAEVTGGQEYACDACWTGWIRRKRLTRTEWLRALGAPLPLLEVHEEHGHPHLP